MGQADVVFHGQHPHHDHADEAGNDGYLDAQAAPHAELIDQSADDAGNGVDFFSEDERHLVDEHIAHHSTGSSRNASHHDGHPEGLPHEERLLYAGNGEQGQSESVENEPRVIESHQPFAEDDETEFYTDNGERVRSKSEVLIANAMKKHGIPYKYECPIVLKGIGKIHPDFTALNIRRRKIYYWEHLGKMDDPDYARKNTFRLNMYEKNGLFHGDSLITTRETSTLPLDTKLLDRMIDHYLLN